MIDAVELIVRENVRYSMWLTHASTDPNYDDEPTPDCDYMIKMIPLFPWVVRTEDPDGLITSSLVDDGVFAGYGKVARFWIERGDYSVSLVPDFNRDGRIDGEDEACITKGETFRFWVNDDNDNQETGDYVSGKKNVAYYFTSELFKYMVGGRQ